MAFFLFILVNAALFIRPAEIVPALLGWEIYFYVIVACFLAALPEVLQYVTGNPPESQPITLFVLGLALVIPIPYLMNGEAGEAWRTGFHFAKVVVYFILFVSIITTPERLRILLLCIVTFAGAVTVLGVLRYHDVIQLQTISTLKDNMAGMYGESIEIKRLQATGIFQDPNELCVLLSALLPICLYFVFTDRNIALRALCVAMVPLYAYAVYLTKSRGGFIAFAGGLGLLAWMQFGWRKAAMLAAVGLPLLLVLFAGRQTEISTKTGTARTRVELWRDWMMTFRENPVVGKGMTLLKDEEQDSRYTGEEKRHAAHNSYLQSFADMGLVGGLMFVGAFFTALWSMYRYNASDSLVLNHDLKTMQPYVMAAIGTFALGMLSLSISYMVPTYMMLGIAVTYTQMAKRSALIAPPPVRLDFALLARIAGVGFCFLTSLYVFVRFVA